jgi:cell filamentation protein
MFCYPDHIPGQMDELFGALKKDKYLKALPKAEFADALAQFLTGLNAIHPFREGNGRTQLIFCAKLTEGAGHLLQLREIEPEPFLSAMIASFNGQERPLRTIFRTLIG